MSVEEIRTNRQRLDIHKVWGNVATLIVVFGFIGYVLTMCFWR